MGIKVKFIFVWFCLMVRGASSHFPPSVYVIGAQKGGSTSMFDYLSKHPLICAGRRKEPHFFDKEQIFSQGIDAYKYNYLVIPERCKVNESLFIDGSPVLHKALVPIRMEESFSRVTLKTFRFIALLREPVSRDYSWYLHDTRTFLNEGHPFSQLETLGELIQSSNHSSLMKGDYLNQLQNYLKVFSRQSFFVINSIDVFSNTSVVMRAIASFLSIDFPDVWFTAYPHKTQAGKSFHNRSCVMLFTPPIDCPTRDLLAEYYAPHNLLLNEWMHRTQSQGLAPPSERAWKPFGISDFKSVSCIGNSRTFIDAIIQQNKELKRCAEEQVKSHSELKWGKRINLIGKQEVREERIKTHEGNKRAERTP